MSDISKFFVNPELKKAFQQYAQQITQGAHKKDAGKDAGNDAGNDAGKDAGNDAGKIEPQAIPYELAERMAIEGENCEPDQVQPYITSFGVLVIPFNSDPKYHYWKPGGQSVCATLKELGRCDLIEKYTHPEYIRGN
ncbi:MAG: hypothetical protein JETT_1864 [Candidatus Jettenia ecosi]|uniref:Uncharacterized protein n=1 Tax=Candidatus Jettenia ecosi TaxID=2494326 RepID=A0A533QAW4_9BACT|nr:MAG: hypothetical protein JETT_1864 [Candidatus Jettenia ecosi]